MSKNPKVDAFLHKLFGTTPGEGMQPKEAIAYSVAGFGQNFICTIIGSYLTVFMTDALGFDLNTKIGVMSGVMAGGGGGRRGGRALWRLPGLCSARVSSTLSTIPLWAASSTEPVRSGASAVLISNGWRFPSASLPFCASCPGTRKRAAALRLFL